MLKDPVLFIGLNKKFLHKKMNIFDFLFVHNLGNIAIILFIVNIH